MSFCTDADLLAHEPNVFTDLPFAGQRTLRITDAEIAGPTLASAVGGFDVLSAGDVVVLGVETPHSVAAAVAAVVDEHTLTLDASPVMIGSSAGLIVEARTFAPQAEVVHEVLLQSLGLNPDDPAAAGAIVHSDAVMRRLEALGTLAFVYAAAITPGGDNGVFEAKAARHRERFHAALRSARVHLDTDGDGEANETRSPGITRLVRE